MRILSFTVENFKKIRVVEIVPKGRITAITGRNGQGKTSVLDALWALFAGKRAIPEKPVRRGANKSCLEATLSDENGQPYLIAKRMIAGDRTTTLTVQAAPGATRPAGTPQAVLDALIGEMSFDPIAFIHMDAKKQADTLRALVKVEVNLDEFAALNRADFEARTVINRRAVELKAQAAAVIYSPGLPAQRIDEAAIHARLQRANEENREIAARLQKRLELNAALERAENNERRNDALIAETAKRIEEIRLDHPAKLRQLETVQGIQSELGRHQNTFLQLNYARGAELQHALATAHGTAGRLCAELVSEGAQLEAEHHLKQQTLEAAEAQRKELRSETAQVRVDLENAPSCEMVDTQALLAELEEAQKVNREIVKRERREELEKQYRVAELEAAQLTAQMERRNEEKDAALAAAKMPVEGLSFNEEGVWFNGIPLGQLGEAEQIRVSCALAMASAPALRCVPIAHGESLDDQSLALLETMAEENDFQIFMARVDTTGKVGIVLEDGMVQAVNG